MKTKTKKLRKDSGQVILFIIFLVLFMILFVSLFVSNSLARHTKVSSGVVNSVQAYYIADAQTENALYKAKADPTILETAGPLYLDNLAASQGGTYVAVVSEVSPTDLRVDVIGTYKNTSRAIQLFW